MATGDPARTASLARFFERVVRQALGDLCLRRAGRRAPTCAQLLTRFARAEELYAIRDAVGRPLDSVAGLLIEAERAWDFRAPDFDPLPRAPRPPARGGLRLVHDRPVPGARRAAGGRRRTTCGRGSAPTRPWPTSSAPPSGRRARPVRRPGGGLRALRGRARLPEARLLPSRRVAAGRPARAPAPDPMVAAALEALVGGEPTDEAVEAALATIPAGELEVRRSGWLARQHGPPPLPILRRCLASRPERARRRRPGAGHAAPARGGESARGHGGARDARRRCAPRLDGRSTGFVRPASTAAPGTRQPPRRGPRLGEAWMSAVDGTGSPRSLAHARGPVRRAHPASRRCSRTRRGLIGLLRRRASRKARVEERLRACRPRATLPWVAVPARWGLGDARRRPPSARTAGGPRAGGTRPLGRGGSAPAAEPAPIHARSAGRGPPRTPRSSSGPRRSAPGPSSRAGSWTRRASSSGVLEWLQARESRLVVSEPDQGRAAGRARRPDHARPSVRRGGRAAPLAGASRGPGSRPAGARARRRGRHRGRGRPRARGSRRLRLRRIPFLRALVERSLEIAGEVGHGPAARPRRPQPNARAPPGQARGG